MDEGNKSKKGKRKPMKLALVAVAVFQDYLLF